MVICDLRLVQVKKLNTYQKKELERALFNILEKTWIRDESLSLFYGIKNQAVNCTFCLHILENMLK